VASQPGSASVSGPDLDVLVREGIGAATSRAITAAEAYGRLGATASFYVRDETGDVRVRVDASGRGTTVWTMTTEEARTARNMPAAVAEPSSPRRPESVRPQPEQEEPLMAARKTKTTARPTSSRSGSARKKTTTAARRPATSASKICAKDAARAVLAKADGPLTTGQIVEGVLATEGVALGGKTPKATIAAILSVENSKPDGLFQRVEKGTYALRPAVAAASGGENEEEAA
jgi:hypothetical protein